MTDEYEVSFSRRLKRPDVLRIGVVVACGLVLLVSAAVTMAASPSASPSAAAGSSSQPNAAPNDGAGGIGNGHAFGRMGMGAMGPGFGMPGMGGRAGGPGFRGPGFGQITIAAINGSSISLKTADGWTRTIAVSSSTTITKAGQTIGVGDLKVGDTIRFRETRNSDGSFAIDAIDVVLPEVRGTVSAVTDSGFTVKSRDGTTWSVTVDGSTKFSLGQQAGSKSDVKVGDEVDVQGTQASGNSLAASAVRIALPTIFGQVTATTASTITVKQFDGTTATIHVGSGTTYQMPGTATPGLSSIAVGSIVAAEGTRNADGSLNATVVRSGPGRGLGRGGFGGGPNTGAPGEAGGTSGSQG